MRNIVFALLLSIGFTHAAHAADRFELDKGHTTFLFFVKHLGYSDMVGRFADYDGHFTFDKDKPEESTIELVFRPAGIKTSSEGLDEHLRKDDFFNVAKFSEVRFVSTGVKVTGKDTGIVTGNLTMLGVTKPVELKVTFNKADFHPMNGKYVAGFTGEATIKRSDFGMTKYVPGVGDEVRIVANVEGVNESKKKPE